MAVVIWSVGVIWSNRLSLPHSVLLLQKYEGNESTVASCNDSESAVSDNKASSAHLEDWPEARDYRKGAGNAEYRDGMLKVTLPGLGQDTSRQTSIQLAKGA